MDWLKKNVRWLWENLQTIAMVVGWAMSFAIPAWATHATSILNDYAPASWVAGGFLGALFAATGYAAISRGRLWHATWRTQELFNQNSDRVNPLDDSFKRQRILIRDLVPPYEPVIRNKTFIDCEILGPINIYLTGQGSMIGVRFFECNGVRVRNDGKTSVAVRFDNCHFLRGTVFRCIILVPEAAYDKMNADMPGINWLTSVPNPAK